MKKTPKNLIEEHLNCYRQYKECISHDNATRLKEQGNIKRETFFVVQKSLVLHILSLVTHQGMPKKEISSILNTLSNSAKECFNSTLSSVYAFCRFYNEYLQDDPYTSEKINTLMTQENIDYFPIWHRSFINDINKSSIETANNGAIIKILWLNKDIRSLFPENVFLSNPQTKRTKPQTNNIFEEDDVLSDKRKNVLPFHYARGLCAPPVTTPQPKKKEYDELLIKYLCFAYKKHSPICENLNVNNYAYWKGVKDTYDPSNICTKNPELFFHTYFILMSGFYERSIASPWCFTENTSLQKFKDIYNRTYNDLKNVVGKNNINTEIVDLMYINWWYDLYTPKIQGPFADYDAKKPTLLENAKIINNAYREIGENSTVYKLIYNSKQFIDGLINSGYLKVAHNTLLNYNENMSARSKDFFDAYYRYPEYKDMATYYLHRLREEALASWN